MDYLVFCDESRTKNQRFMLFGGLVLDRTSLTAFKKDVEEFRATHNMNHELKWSKVSRFKLDKYKAFVDLFFKWNDNNHIHFHSLIIDTHAIKNKKYNQGDQEKMYFKFYYQLLLNRCVAPYHTPGEDRNYYIYLDAINTRQERNELLLELTAILNNGFSKNIETGVRPFRMVRMVDSKKSTLLQMVDVILGGVGFRKNGWHKAEGSSAAKNELAQYILKKSKLDNFQDGTIWSVRKFALWLFRMGK